MFLARGTLTLELVMKGALFLASVSMVVSPIRLNKIGIKEQDLELRV